MSTNKQTLAFFWHHARRYPKYVVGLAIVVPLTILIQQFLPPLVVAHVLDRLSKGDFVRDDLWGSFGPDLLLFAGLTILGSMVGWRLAIRWIWRLEMLVTRDIARHTFNHLMSMSATFHANRFGGSLVSQASKLTGAYIRMADTVVFQITSTLLAFSFTVFILWPRAPLFVIGLTIFSALFVITAILITRHIRALNAAEAAAVSRQTGQLADSITNLMAVKSFAAGKREGKRYAKATDETHQAGLNLMYATTKKELTFSGITSGMAVLSFVMAAGSVVLFDADISTAFLILSYTTNISNRLNQFAESTLRNLNRSLGDAKDMIEILQLSPEVKDPTKPEKVRIKDGSISLHQVSFRHDGAPEDDILFKNFDLNIKAGEKIGLVGHSGSGKTTLTRLLLRLSDIQKGEILLDGQNITHITQDDLRANIAYVPQEPLLFHRSLSENIAYGKPSATQKEIEAAARKAHAHEFIEKLPEGYDTLVGERGVKLSGGQRQRIAIARAILKDAPILVLDEATSALDSESEKLIQQALWELMKGRTAIVIAHRLSTIQKMDRIVVLENGTIVEEGSHKALLKNKGTYAELWAHQSGGFIEE